MMMMMMVTAQLTDMHFHMVHHVLFGPNSSMRTFPSCLPSLLELLLL